MKLSEIRGALECFPEDTVRAVDVFDEKVRVEYYLNPLHRPELPGQFYQHEVRLSELRAATDLEGYKSSVRNFIEFEIAKLKGVYP